MTNYEAVIGLEIHAELATPTKMFCGCRNDPFHAPEPNIYVCPVCFGLPGALPVMNREAVMWATKVGLALGCAIGWPVSGGRLQATGDSNNENLEIHSRQPVTSTKWDRKNYFYPDLPKGYQISQYDLPLCHGGQLSIGDRDIAITRIHLEEDTGKLVHPNQADYSLVDYNRSGVPLLELVTEPEIRTGAEAAAFAQAYQLMLRTLGVAHADMEKGGMRVEVNLSLRPKGTTTFGTKVEVKNLNSFRSVQKAIEFEMIRQAELLASGETVVHETRGWDEGRQVTFAQRSKETAAEYRYFPEPDLPPVTIGETGINLEAIKADLPELPMAKRARYGRDFGLGETEAQRIVTVLETDRRFVAEINTLPEVYKFDHEVIGRLAKWLLNRSDWHVLMVGQLAELLTIGAERRLPESILKHVYEQMIADPSRTASDIVESEKIDTIRDTGAVDELIRVALQTNAPAVAEYRAGKEQVLGFLVGAVMSQARGQADPSLVRERLIVYLKEEGKHENP